MARSYDELSDEEKKLAQERCLNNLLSSILDGRMRFDDELNGEPVQAHIDAAMNKADELQTPWFAGEMMMEDDWLKEVLITMADAEAKEALYVKPDVTVIRL